ncbi:MAG: ChbG/HpnK family deacetylase [Acidimicrobiales bacterium]
MTATLERLGRPSSAKLVIIAAEGLGCSNAATMGVYAALREGVATTASIQVPCPWARGAAAVYAGEDVGVSLTLNSQHEFYRWGPITHAPSLLDGDGGFPRTAADLWDHADLEETRRECRAQIERAIVWGFPITHLSAHLDALCSRPEFFDVYLDLAVEFNLPISLPDPSLDLGFPARELAAEEGILVPDRVIGARGEREARSALQAVLTDLQPGVSELRLSPAVDTPELRALTPNWAARVGDAHLITHDQAFNDALTKSGAELIGFRELQLAQRT